MADVLLFHHAQGQTPGFLGFADELRNAGHDVHAPDLYHGRTFDDLTDGVAYADEIGFEDIVARGVGAAEGLPTGLVYAGFSLGVLPAQKLAQTRPGARGALLFHSCLPVPELGRRGRTGSRCRSTPWRRTRSSSTRATVTRLASWSVPPTAEEPQLETTLRRKRADQETTRPRPVIGGRSSAVTIPGAAATTAGMALTRRMAVALRPAVLWSPSVPISWRSRV
jgi:hypothetical protein